MTGREVAWRVFAREFTASRDEERGVGDRGTSYVLSPLGARMNRVLVAGVLSPPESGGRDPDSLFVRSRLEDPTGAVTVTAGGFQPRALTVLRTLTQPTPAVVVGKAHLFRGRDGVAYPSVRAEGVRTLAVEELRAFLVDALEQTTTRIRLIRTGSPDGHSPTVGSGAPPSAWIQAMGVARLRAPGDELDSLEESLRSVRRVVDGETTLGSAVGPRPTTVVPGAEPRKAPARAKIVRAPPPPVAKTLSAADRAEESSLLDVVDQLAEKSADGYAGLAEVVRAAARSGITAERAEVLLGRLEESGAVEEPIVGKLRRA